jgi:hypothetical protein
MGMLTDKNNLKREVEKNIFPKRIAWWGEIEKMLPV